MAGAAITDIDPGMEELLRQRSERPVYLHPVWLRTWLSEFGDRCEPLFLTAEAEGSLIGVAPLMRQDDRLTFIGDANICDYMDVLVAPDHGAEAYESLCSQICAKEWHDFDL